MRPQHTNEATTGLISTIVQVSDRMHSECSRCGFVGQRPECRQILRFLMTGGFLPAASPGDAST